MPTGIRTIAARRRPSETVGDESTRDKHAMQKLKLENDMGSENMLATVP
jgi:hypothetical protein